MLYAAIIVLCGSADISTCHVIKHPTTFTDLAMCKAVLDRGVKETSKYAAVYRKSFCLEVPVGEPA